MKGEEMSVLGKLLKVQQELKVPKSKPNTFGGYKYRTVDMIVEKLKPLLDKYGLVLVMGDSMELIGERYYIKATAKLMDVAGEHSIEVTAYARETLERKKSDDSQLTGAASTYARKYALNGLFLLDDTTDPDSYGAPEPQDDDDAELDRQEAEELAKRVARRPRTRRKKAAETPEQPAAAEEQESVDEYLNPPETEKEEVPFEETLKEDTYFYIESTGNYVRKHKGDVAPEGGRVITKEEFVQGSAEIATKPTRRTRRVRKER